MIENDLQLSDAKEQLDRTIQVIHVNDIKPEDTDVVYIGRAVPRRGLRASKWHNPFRMLNKSPEERERVIRAFRAYVMESPGLLAQLPELKGKRLACWCAPEACHGDVLAELAEALE